MSRTDETEEWTGRRIAFDEFAAKVQERRELLGDRLVIPRNDGTLRTPSKRALLKAIKATGADW